MGGLWTASTGGAMLYGCPNSNRQCNITSSSTDMLYSNHLITVPLPFNNITVCQFLYKLYAVIHLPLSFSVAGSCMYITELQGSMLVCIHTYQWTLLNTLTLVNSDLGPISIERSSVLIIHPRQ